MSTAAHSLLPLADRLLWGYNSCDVDQKMQRIVDRFAGGECARDVGVEQHDVGAGGSALMVLTASRWTESGEIVLGPQVVWLGARGLLGRHGVLAWWPCGRRLGGCGRPRVL